MHTKNHFDSEGNYVGPERRTSTPGWIQRRMVLTEADLDALAERLDVRHRCRYDVDPEDMTKLIGFVRTFHSATVETKAAVRKFVLRRIIPWFIVAAAAAGLADAFGWLRPIIEAWKRKGP